MRRKSLILTSSLLFVLILLIYKQVLSKTKLSTTTSATSFTSTRNNSITVAVMQRRHIDVPLLCPNSTMDEDYRHTVLAMHNNFRSSIAIGLRQVNGQRAIAPTAKLMYNMPLCLFYIYDCDAEMNAQLHVRMCDGNLSSSFSAGSRFEENIDVLEDTSRTDYMGAVQHAITEWWKELFTYGIPSDMLYSHNVSKTKNIDRFVKMAWWNNVFLGCATKKCPEFYFTSCMYGDGGSMVGARIYEVGAPCSGCGPNCDLNVGLCTWSK